MIRQCSSCGKPFVETLSGSSDLFGQCLACRKSALVGEQSKLKTVRSRGAAVQDVALPTIGEMVSCFRIESLAGTGAFGTVFLANDLVLDRKVAIKFPLSEELRDEHNLFLIQEARSAARLKHPNIVTVYEVDVFSGNTFIVSDYIDGTTLSVWIEQADLNVPQTVNLFEKLLDAVHFAHEQGVVHRDLKPENILIDLDGEPHISDFGSASFAADHFFGDARYLGTPLYQAPEQRIDSRFQVDERSDIYSLGVIFSELLSHCVNCGATAADDSNGDFLDRLANVCRQATQPVSDHRFQSVKDFRQAVSVIQKEFDNPVRPVMVSGANRVAAVTTGFFGLALLAVVIMAFSWLPWKGADFKDVANSSVKTNIPVQISLDVPLESVVALQIDRRTMPTSYGFMGRKTIQTLRPAASHDLVLDPGEYSVTLRLRDGSKLVMPRTIKEHTENWSQQIEIEEQRLVDKSRIGGVPRLVSRTEQWIFENVQSARRNPDGTFQLGPEILVRVPGGSFLSGSDFFKKPAEQDELLYPFRETSVPDLYVGQHEVIVDNFESVMGYLPEAMEKRFPQGVPGGIPVTNVSFYEASLYCQKIGARLPTFDEYAFVATNAGITRFPWGNQPDLKPDDRSLHDIPVYGLYSSLLEWTTDINIPYSNSDSEIKWPTQILQTYLDSRVIVGGSSVLARGESIPENTPMLGARCFEMASRVKTPTDYQGFRVYR